jgi:hypothetical protein
MNKPLNQTAEVLFELIQKKNVSRMMFFKNTGILNVTARIAELRIDYGIEIRCKKVSAMNKHGRTIKYGVWSLSDIERCIEVYKIINN